MISLDLIIEIGLGIVFICVILLSLVIIRMGKKIAETPDLNELRKGKTPAQSWSSPEKSSYLFVISFIIINIIGDITVMLSDSTTMLIIGSVIVFSSLLFTVTVMFFEMVIYSKMKTNQRKWEDGVVVT